MSAHRHYIHNSPRLMAIQMHVSSRMDEQGLRHMFHGLFIQWNVTWQVKGINVSPWMNFTAIM